MAEPCSQEAPVVDPDAHLPKSSSSAMPDLSSSNVPRLKARVHQRLSAERCARLRLSDLEYRPLRTEDYQDMVALHTEWFPVSYDENFYNKSVGGDIFTLAAVHNHATSSGNAPATGSGCFPSSVDSPSEPPGSVHSSLSPRATSSSAPIVATQSSSSECDMLGIVTMSVNCEHHCDDIMSVLNGDCATLCRGGRVDEPISTNGTSNLSNRGCLAYILTLGIIDGFRRRGLARELLRQSIDYVDKNMPEVQAVYLHVVTYNEAAIQLYESMRFVRLERFTSFYHLHGHPYDSYLYARYLHHGRPPWKWRLRNLLGWHSWTDWVKSAWTSIWKQDGTSEDKQQASPV